MTPPLLRARRSAFVFTTLAVAGLGQAAFAATIPMNLVNPNGSVAPAGSIEAEATPYGVKFTPNLKDLPPGIHGFHVHENPSCEFRMTDGKLVPAAAAGGHYDPAKTGKHLGPWGDGHLGDLPALYVDTNGTATYPVLAPRLKIGDLKGRALMVHVGGDNHADHPAPLGGGGVRLACGVVP